MTFQKPFNPLKALIERFPRYTQPFVQLIRVNVHLISQCYHSKPLYPPIPRKPANSVIRAVERNVP